MHDVLLAFGSHGSVFARDFPAPMPDEIRRRVDEKWGAIWKNANS